jgi:flagellin
MVFSLRTNTNSLTVQTELNKTTNALSEKYQRLASGLRINSAKDDPAGLALADALRADAKLATVAMNNINDGISLTEMADAALGEISNILSRMSELSNQSANGVYTMTQRSALQIEFSALGSEIERIAQTTTYNNISLLSNSSQITLQVGFNSNANSQITLTNILGTLSSLGLSGAGSSTLTYSIIATTSVGAQAAASTALTAVRSAMNLVTASRGTLGAAESRLSYAISNLSSAREVLNTAESRIRDADIAQEVAELVRLQVIQQAGTAILAQANQTPATVLSLVQF